ncbi:hypothetical protein [Ethanoligenens harbinense]|uniref:Holin n=1 Tax=Ethanoligenens harbinense (strain DSM 18485 / JCM 12961 / CGMCC 1.5033 / YUAN-3) TaxID=663278 RepID=E6U620_ETHHY|nr:hypothetical protein [Ethanoligenens harbinense]ADU25699.1 hypothetical protein Ethha_0109 [Ethanoligenens harbinense YUAN-3]
MSNLKKLLSDKSFWAAVIALSTSILISFNVPQGSVEQITAIIAAGGTFIAYIVSTGIQSAAQIKADAQIKTAQIAVQARTSEQALTVLNVQNRAADDSQGVPTPLRAGDGTKEDK